MVRFIKIILIFIVIFFGNTIHAAILNDSIVVVLADWNKKEKHLFRYTQYEYKIVDGDTIETNSFYRDFYVEVSDSTQHLYSLKYSRVQMPTKCDSIPLDEFPLQLMTNRNGALIKVLNWDSYLQWRNNDVEITSNDIYPYVSILSFNGKRLNLKHRYNGSQKVNGVKFGCSEPIVSKSEMIIGRDFEKTGEYELITIKTTTTYYKSEDSPIPVVDNFMQMIDSENGWALATYFERNKKERNIETVNAWNIKLLD